MNLPDDLKDYRAEDDPFRILSPDQCVIALVALIGLVALGWPILTAGICN